MKEIVMYECEICKQVHRKKENALLCEERSKEQPLADIGQMVIYKIKIEGGYTPLFVDLRIKEIKDKGHYLIYCLEEYCEESDTWIESNVTMGDIWGNEKFKELCTVKESA